MRVRATSAGIASRPTSRSSPTGSRHPAYHPRGAVRPSAWRGPRPIRGPSTPRPTIPAGELMPVEWLSTTGQLHLHNGRLSHVLRVLPSGSLVQLHFGAPLRAGVD